MRVISGGAGLPMKYSKLSSHTPGKTWYFWESAMLVMSESPKLPSKSINCPHALVQSLLPIMPCHRVCWPHQCESSIKRGFWDWLALFMVVLHATSNRAIVGKNVNRQVSASNSSPIHKIQPWLTLDILADPKHPATIPVGCNHPSHPPYALHESRSCWH